LLHAPKDGPVLSKEEADRVLQEHLEYDHRLQRDGHFVTAGPLADAREGRAVRVRDGKLSVTDGPFAETKEELGGFFVIEAKDLDQAVQLASEIPIARFGWIEVRPFRDLYTDLHPPAPPARKAAGRPEARFVDRPSLTLAGFGTTYTPETMGRIPAQWMRFGRQATELMGKVGESLGLCSAWKDGKMEYVTALPVPPGRALPDGWRYLTLPAQQYAVFSHEDHVSKMGEAAHWIIGTWLPSSGKKLAPGFGGGIGFELLEWYGPKFNPETGFDDIEFWVPIQG
jgi:predicted transcriptional regulator YdeE